MSRWVKMLIGIALLPLCLGMTEALVWTLKAGGTAERVWVPFLGGAACWLVVYLLLPKPLWLYVVGHELTHVLWTWACGGRVKRIRCTSRGGSVSVSKANFLTMLAPYFFPFYAACLVTVFGIGHWIWGWTSLRTWFHLLLGVAYGFHVTLTWQVLQHRQTDITQHGILFSAVVIWMGNLSVLLLGVALLTDEVSLWTVGNWSILGVERTFLRLGQLVGL